MRTLVAALLAVVALAPQARSESPASCGSVTVKKLAFSTDNRRFTLIGIISAGAGFPDIAHGGATADVKVWLAYEPETDPANALFTGTLPQAKFRVVPNGIIFDDPKAASGITRMVIRTQRDGTRKLSIKSRSTPLQPPHAGVLRFTIGMKGGCSRTCPSPCTITKGHAKCMPSTETRLCGVKTGCDPLNIVDGVPTGNGCLLPYPSDFHARDDATTPTGKRLAYLRGAMPQNDPGVAIDPAPYNVLDGFSPGPVITARWPQGVDLAASNVPGQLAFGDSLSPSSPIQLIAADAPGCQRVELMGENDVSIGHDGVNPVRPPDQAFLMRPGRRLQNATHYIVALQGLVGQDGHPIPPGTTFAALRDGTMVGYPPVDARRAHYEDLFDKLTTDCGLTRSALTSVWDFTTASDDAITRWLLSMRDQAFAPLGASGAPPFTIGTITPNPTPEICRRVEGTFTAPLFTTFDGPGSVLKIDPLTNLPVQNGTTEVPFRVEIPCILFGPGHAQGRPVFYGHGLLGSRNEVGAGNLRTLMNTYGFVLGAVDWQGFSNADVGTVIGFLGDLSGFPKLAERLHQGVLNQLLFGRLLHSPTGLPSDPNFIDNGVSVIDPSQIYWYGISQGGIEGGVVMALTQDVTRGVLGVPAANYSTLLHRSVDFAPFFALLRNSYPDDIERVMALPVIQQLWDRSEPNGWYHHTLPGDLPDTPAHKLLIHMATSDAEVANLGTTIMVRSLGIPQVSPPVSSYYDIPELAAPFDGSAMLESDGHYGPVPLTNTPPAPNTAHGDMRGRPAIQAQIDAFLRPDGVGLVQDFCSGPCDPE